MPLLHYFTVKKDNYTKKSKVPFFSLSFLEGVLGFVWVCGFVFFLGGGRTKTPTLSVSLNNSNLMPLDFSRVHKKGSLPRT